MCTRDEVRAAIRTFNKAKFTNRDLANLLPHLSKHTMSQAIIKLGQGEEIEKCGRVSLPRGGGLDLMKEKNLKMKYVRPEIVRKDLDLKGWRKVFPELFIDPRIPGQVRFVDNGLRQ